MGSNEIEVLSRDAAGDEWTAFFVGDCILEGDFDRPPVSEGVNADISTSSISVCNLEAPIAVEGAGIEKKGPVKHTEPDTPETLRTLGFDAATLANNHIMDYGEQGLHRTREACEMADLTPFGADEDHDAALSPYQTTIQDTTLAIISVCEREFSIVQNGRPGAAWTSHPDVVSRIYWADEAFDVVVVVDHGGLEHVPLPPPSRQQRLRSFVRAGADAVIGHHPHVAQGWEVYQRSPIFYSLGNFLFKNHDYPGSKWNFGVKFGIADSAIDSATVHLYELGDGRTRELGKSRDVHTHTDYLQRVSELLVEGYAGHWQALACRKFDRWYDTRFAYYGSPRPLALLRYPIWLLDEITRGKLRTDDRKREHMLYLLNYLQNESHNDVIRTALRLRTGVDTDHRTPTVQRTLSELLQWTEQQDTESFTERWIRRAKLATDRLL